MVLCRSLWAYEIKIRIGGEKEYEKYVVTTINF